MNSNDLTPEHCQEWESSGVHASIVLRNVWSISDPTELDELLNRNTKRRWKHSTELVPGWAVVGVDPRTGERRYLGAQYKPDNPPIDPENGKPRKYFSPSDQALAPLFLEMQELDYWAQQIASDSPIVITEGAKKAGAILSQGIPAISIPGVSCGAKHGRLHKDLKLFLRFGRPVYLAFDQDILTKPAVRAALISLGRMLTETGVNVYVLEWEGPYKGIDDALVSGLQIDSAIQNASTLQEWKSRTQTEAALSIEGERCALARRYELIKEKLGKRLSFNELKSRAELDGEPIEPDRLRIMLALRWNIQVGLDDCQSICSDIAKDNIYSPVRDYLNGVAAALPPDGDLLDGLALEYLGTGETLHSVYLRKTLISAVARAFKPGCKVDTVGILTGEQGAGKSSFWKTLASEEWFDDTVGSATDKDERLKLHQAWFIEWAELEAVFRRKDISAVKAFITTQIDQVRPPYGRTVQEFKRPSIIVGSTNETGFLSDATGNRRYWVIPVLQEIPLDRLQAERDRIWAAAVHAFRAGESWALPREYYEAAREDANDYVSVDPWEKPILEWVEWVGEITTSDILTNCLRIELAHQDKRSEMRVANVLKKNGWGSVRRLVHGRKLRSWQNPKFIDLGRSRLVHKGENGSAQGGPTLDQPPDQPPSNGVGPQENSNGSLQISREWTNLTDLTNNFPKRSRSQDLPLCQSEIPPEKSIAVGSVVQIKVGRFCGAVVKVLDVKGGVVTVKKDGWVVDREYSLEEVELINGKA